MLSASSRSVLLFPNTDAGISTREEGEVRTAVAATWILGVGLLAPQIARADSVIVTYTFPSPLLDYASADGASFSQFNPAAGTLNSITLHTTATATWSGGADSDLNEAEYTISLSGFAFIIGAERIGDGSAGAASNFTETKPAVLSGFMGTGTVDTSVSVLNDGGSLASISSAFGTESVTYNYTPGTSGVPPITSSPSVPEPSSVSLLAVGLLGLGWISRSRPHRAI